MNTIGNRKRNGLYYLMLAEAETNLNIIKDEGRLPTYRPWGMCSTVTDITDGLVNLGQLPEIKEHEPRINEAGPFWFNIHTEKGWERRINIIKKAIKKTENG